MDIFIESGTAGHSLVSVEKGVCQACGHDEGAYYYLQYHYTNFMRYLGMVADRKYFVVCKRCKARTAVSRAEVEKVTKADRLYLHQKYGMYVLLAAVAWLGWSYFSSLR